MHCDCHSFTRNRFCVSFEKMIREMENKVEKKGMYLFRKNLCQQSKMSKREPLPAIKDGQKKLKCCLVTDF